MMDNLVDPGRPSDEEIQPLFSASQASFQMDNSKDVPDDLILSPRKVMQKGVNLAQSYFEKGCYEEAQSEFEKWIDQSPEAKYQLAVISYDGLCGKPDYKRAVSLIEDLSKDNIPGQEHLTACARYNLGRAYYEGYGVPQSDSDAEKFWLQAAEMNNMKSGCVKAQSTLGMFYARQGEESYDLDKSHFWHQEATGNGSIESQGALGVMYEHGLGVKKDSETAFKCFKSASERGNVYAMGNLAMYYYKQKLYMNAAEISRRVASIEDTGKIAQQTGCLEAYIRKGVALGSFIYGRCAQLGLALPKSQEEAEKWYSRAAELDLNTVAKMQEAMTLGQL